MALAIAMVADSVDGLFAVGTISTILLAVEYLRS